MPLPIQGVRLWWSLGASMEWNNENRFNSFNSWKGLTYARQYQQILRWMKGETRYLPPPIECNLDPIAECNNRCYFCVTQRYLVTKREEVGPMRILPGEYMRNLVKFLARWGVKGLCISGGGEPSLHPEIASVIMAGVDAGMDVAFVTNAVSM